MSDIQSRFWSKVDRSGGPDACWPWVGTSLKAGYGIMRHSGRHRTTHRISWEMSNRKLVDGECVLHRCDNPPCVNPAHLFVGTKADNNRDRDAKNRVAHGVRQWCAKLTPDDVAEIRKRIAEGENPRLVGVAFGVSRTHVRRVASGASWRRAA